MENQEVISMPRIGETAPEIQSSYNSGNHQFPF
jgi:hypothetical protein